MLDEDLAKLYQVETAYLVRQMKRNIERFPEDFMFQLSKKEWGALKSHFGISKSGRSNQRPRTRGRYRNVQTWLGHESISTTRLYDKRKDRPEEFLTYKVEY